MFLHISFENKKITLSIKDEQFNETHAVEYPLEYSHADQLISQISKIIPNTKYIRGIVVTKKGNMTSFTLQRIVVTVVNTLGYALKILVAYMDESTSFNSLQWQEPPLKMGDNDIITQ
jgi:hypothetical protein